MKFKKMEEQDVRIRELIDIIKVGEYFESLSFDDPHGTYYWRFTFPIEKRRKAIKELKKIAKNSPKEVRKWIFRWMGLPSSRSSRVLRYFKVGLLGLAIGAGAGKGCERYVYHQKVKEAERKVGSTISEEYNITYTPEDVKWFKKKYREKQFSKNIDYMGIGGLVALVPSLLIAGYSLSLESRLNTPSLSWIVEKGIDYTKKNDI